MSLYHKHRPTTLDEMWGNESTIQAIRDKFAGDPDNFPHAMLMTGPSGCGKTTLARLIAKDILSCEGLNIREINTANNRGIDSARDIMEQMKYLPAGGGKVVYIIDEAHGMTQDAKRAFLKPLEDTPKHVFFILCTTDYPKLTKGDEGKAINTRCVRYTVNSLEDMLLYRNLRQVARKEEFTHIPDEVLEACGKAANGSPRAALQMLDKVSCMAPEKMLEAIDSPVDETPEMRDLCFALGAADWHKVSKVLLAMKEGGTDPETIRRTVLGWFQGSVLKRPQAARGAMIIMECFEKPTYDIGFPGITIAAYQACNAIRP